MDAIILAGGRGTRLQGVVADLPKPMASVAGRPFLEYILDRLVNSGITKVVLAVGYKAELIERHFGSDYKSISISYSYEPELRGTGGAIAHAINANSRQPVLVLNGDTLLDIDYRTLIAWYYANPARIAIVLRRVDDAFRYGAVTVVDGVVREFLEKGIKGPGLINAGVYIIHPDIISESGLSDSFSFELDILQKNCSTLLPRAYISENYFIDIGTPDDYRRAQSELSADN